MILTLIPIWGRDEGPITVSGDTLTRYGVDYDLSAVPEGGEGWPSHPAPGEDHVFIGPIRRRGGKIHATLLVHLDATAPFNQPAAPWTLSVDAGPVIIPALRIPADPPEPPEVTQ